MIEKILISPFPQIYAHRGAAALYPENTLEGYLEAIKMPIDVIDIDVGMTKDGVVVAYHDFTLSPSITSDRNKQFIDNDTTSLFQLTFSELQQYEVGRMNPLTPYKLQHPDRAEWNNIKIPALKVLLETINRIQPNMRVQIEIKTSPYLTKVTATPNQFVDEILNVLQETQFLAKTEIHSFDWRNLIYLVSLKTAVSASFITHFPTWQEDLRPWTAGHHVNEFGGSLGAMIKGLGGSIWCPSFEDLAENHVQDAHQHGLKVVPWSPLEAEDLHYLVSLGVDGIITDRPDRLIQIKTQQNNARHISS